MDISVGTSLVSYYLHRARVSHWHDGVMGSMYGSTTHSIAATDIC